MKCQKCGMENNDLANFCKICGTRMEHLKWIEPADDVEQGNIIKDERIENSTLRDNIQVHDSEQNVEDVEVKAASIQPVEEYKQQTNTYGNYGKGLHLFLLLIPPMVYFMWAFVFQSFVYLASEALVRDIWIAMYHALFPLVHVSLLLVVFRKNANFAYAWYGVYFLTRVILMFQDVEGSFIFTSIHVLAMDCYIMISEYAIAYWIKQQTKHSLSEKMQMQLTIVVLVLSYPVLHWVKNVADSGQYYVPFHKFTIIGLLFGLIWLNILMKSVGYSNNIVNNNSTVSA